MNEKVKRALFELMQAITRVRKKEDALTVEPYIARASAALREINAPSRLLDNLHAIREVWLVASRLTPEELPRRRTAAADMVRSIYKYLEKGSFAFEQVNQRAFNDLYVRKPGGPRVPLPSQVISFVRTVVASAPQFRSFYTAYDQWIERSQKMDGMLAQLREQYLSVRGTVPWDEIERADQQTAQELSQFFTQLSRVFEYLRYGDYRLVQRPLATAVVLGSNIIARHGR
ncbi:MAG: hypothetical protein KatS3mg038_1003 [Candidatus Kapaibacterium sp.]|nr:MAG: hypothetical protein KatS3mg038_1003 [Candidatus Kapabacteria bacterium]